MDNKTQDINKSNKIDQPQMLMISADQLLRLNTTEDEIDLKEIFSTLWQGKWLIISVTAVFAIASIIYALSLPNIYKSSATLVPISDEEKSLGAGLSQQFGGIASLAGISIGGEGVDKAKIAIETLKSNEFLANFVANHDLKAKILAAKSWDFVENKIEFDEEIYNQKTNQWTWKSKRSWNNDATEPSNQEAVKEFKKNLEISHDEKKGRLVIISISHVSPYIAQQWVRWLIEDINSLMRKQDIHESQRTIDYLNRKLEETSVAEMHRIFFEIIEQQTKIKMLAEVREQYVLKVIDPANIPEFKDKPARGMIFILASLLGVFTSSFWLIFRSRF